MEITEVRIKLMEDNHERLQAFCSVTFDNAFVVRDVKIIEGAKGSFVAMPSRKLTDRCSHCGYKNHLRSRFCNNCGSKLDEDRATRDVDGRAKLHADIAHPINSACREKVQAAIIKAYNDELERSKLPGYKPTYDEYEPEFEPGFDDVLPMRRPAARVAAESAPAPRRRAVGARESFADGLD
ncbi:MAG TPA: SpoVG family protein [Planctomycetia bacterium]|nr:SpoVG family protein [Planctomycetia bacterium]